jgi:hypothetical protein
MTVKEFATIATRLSQALLRFDEDNPGDADAPVEVPSEVWADWIDLAGQLDADDESEAAA